MVWTHIGTPPVMTIELISGSATAHDSAIFISVILGILSTAPLTSLRISIVFKFRSNTSMPSEVE
jgi:hypothetical protein